MPTLDFLVCKIKEREFQNSFCRSLTCFSIYPGHCYSGANTWQNSWKPLKYRKYVTYFWSKIYYCAEAAPTRESHAYKMNAYCQITKSHVYNLTGCLPALHTVFRNRKKYSTKKRMAWLTVIYYLGTCLCKN